MPNEIGTQPGWCRDFARCYWYFYDRRGQRVATITDEAYALVGLTPRDIVMASS